MNESSVPAKDKKPGNRTPGAVSFLLQRRDSPLLNLIFSIVVPLCALLVMEWIARGTLGVTAAGHSFWAALGAHFPSFLLAFILLVCVYVAVSQLTGLHAVATFLLGLVAVVPSTVTWFKLNMRNEPFLPWDLTQIEDLMGVQDNLSLIIPWSVIISIGIYIVLTVLAIFVRVPRGQGGRSDWLSRLISGGAALVCGAILMFAVFLNPAGSLAMGIQPDMWMQDRYYRSNGVLTGFLTNLQMLNIAEPEGYGPEAVERIAAEANAGGAPLYETSFATNGGTVENPDIIYLMAESFWDVTALPGVTYDRELLPNYKALSAEGASGHAYTPSFGGGTCDVEFEALTGFSVEHLPAGSKPYQQYLGDPAFALPNYLKTTGGYETLAIHGYGRRFWNRDLAYPSLGIDTFYGSEDFINPERRRGFISDNAMVDRIIAEHSAAETGTPMFIHAVTMQNHTTYSRDRYPASELVKVTGAPETLSDSVIGQLEDCATGIYEMDAALGKLCDYLKGSDRAAVVVFWGDHMNPMSDGYGLFEETGYIAPGDTAAPQLRTTPLLVWSNFSTEQTDLGTLASYNISPVMMDLYGLPKPVMFEFLARQLPVLRGRAKGITIGPNDTFAEEMTAAQQKSFNEHAILQYDFLFGERLLEDYVQAE